MLGAAGHYNDTDTGVHIWRMAAYAGALAREVGWDETRAVLLELAASMHDTGKMGIPSHILRKPGPLDAEEWVIMKGHPRIGWSILSKGNGAVFELAAEIALRHHERWDGSGYPDGLSGPTIPESARIVAVADVFDALTVRRPYKEAWSVENAFAMIESSAGTHLDPELVAGFVKIRPKIEELRRAWADRESGMTEDR